jgi:hypothetical protein
MVVSFVDRFEENVARPVWALLEKYDMNNLKPADKKRPFSCFRAYEAITLRWKSMHSYTQVPEVRMEMEEKLFLLCIKLLRTPQLEKRIAGMDYFEINTTCCNIIFYVIHFFFFFPIFFIFRRNHSVNQIILFG